MALVSQITADCANALLITDLPVRGLISARASVNFLKVRAHFQCGRQRHRLPATGASLSNSLKFEIQQP